MYLALYRKYRPLTFEDVISQPHIITTLINQLKNKQTVHAYLFTGSRGTGKTSCAKILAKALNCTNLKNGNPCLECDNCTLINEGTPDIIEIDAASNNGVDDVRALRDEIVYMPVSCKYRVYIIDEVHMLSSSAFNALLKTLEEPPSHVVFILATTENHKVPATILSRCQRFEFHRIKLGDSADKLVKIAESENLKLDREAAELISKLSDGGMRDAISLLDTCSAATNDITYEVVKECAGVSGREYLFALSDAVIENNPGKALKITDKLYSQSKDMGRLIDEFLEHFRNVMLIKITSNNIGILTCLPDETDEYLELSTKFNLPRIIQILDILAECYEKTIRSKDRKTLIEICLVRLCSPRLDTDNSALLSRIETLESRLENTSFNQNNTVSVNSDDFVPHYAENENVHEYFNDEPIPPNDEYGNIPEYVEISNVPQSVENKNVPINSKNRNKRDFLEWQELLNFLPPYIGAVMEKSIAYVENNDIVVSGNDVTKSIINNPDNRALIISTLYSKLGLNYGLKFAGDLDSKQHDTEEEDRLKIFLDKISALGIKIKRK